MCTKHEIINTGINMDTVNESKLNPQNTFKYSESIQLNNFIVTGTLLSTTSKNVIITNTVVVIIETHVTNCAPLTPIFLPKKPEIIDPIRGSIIIDKYIT
jgi:hypothetical protein